MGNMERNDILKPRSEAMTTDGKKIALPPHWYMQLRFGEKEFDFDRAEKITGVLNTRNVEDIYILIHHETGIGHWTLIHMDVKCKEIRHYDSLGRVADSMEHTNRVQQWWGEKIKSEAGHTGWHVHSRTTWRTCKARTALKANGWDCEIIALLTFFSISSGTKDIKFETKDVPRLLTWIRGFVLSSRPPPTLSPPRAYITPDTGNAPTTTKTPVNLTNEHPDVIPETPETPTPQKQHSTPAPPPPPPSPIHSPTTPTGQLSPTQHHTTAQPPEPTIPPELRNLPDHYKTMKHYDTPQNLTPQHPRTPHLTTLTYLIPSPTHTQCPQPN